MERLLEVFVKNLILLISIFIFSSLMNVSFAENFYGSCPGGIVQGSLNGEVFEKYVPLDSSGNSPNPPSCVKVANSINPLRSQAVTLDPAICLNGDHDSYFSWLVQIDQNFFMTFSAEIPYAPIPLGNAPEGYTQHTWSLQAQNIFTGDEIFEQGAFQCRSEGFKIEIGQTNLTDSKDGNIFSVDKDILVTLEKIGANYVGGDNFRVELFRLGQTTPAVTLIDRALTTEETALDKIVFKFNVAATNIGQYDLVATLRPGTLKELKSKEYFIELKNLPSKKILITRLIPPVCGSILCYNPVLDSEYQSKISATTAFAHKIFPYDSLGSDSKLEFVIGEAIEGTPLQIDTFIQDIKSIDELRAFHGAERVIVIVDEYYFQWLPIQGALKLPSTIWGVYLKGGAISFVRTTSPLRTFAHELAHSFGVSHSTTTNLPPFVPRSGYSEKNLDGYDVVSSKYLKNEDFIDLMWTSSSLSGAHWIHKSTYNDLVQKISEDQLVIQSATLNTLQIGGYISPDGILTDVSTTTVAGGSVSGNEPTGTHSVVALNSSGGIISETKFTPSFTLDPDWDATETEFNPIILDKTPILLNIPMFAGIDTLQVRNGNIVLEEIVVPDDNLTLIEAINLIPNLGFKKNSTKSRQELATLAQKVDLKIQSHDYNKAIDLLKELQQEAKKLIMNHYVLNKNEISKKEFITLIRREIRRVKELKRIKGH